MVLSKKLFSSLICFLFLTSSANAQVWEYFKINAQYRSGVKKSYEDIGCAISYFVPLAPQKLQVISHVCAVNPKKRNKAYAFKLNMVLNIAGDQVKIVKKIYSDFKGIRPDYFDEIEDLIAGWTFIRENWNKQEQLQYQFVVGKRIIKQESKILSRGKRKEIVLRTPNKKGPSGKVFLHRAQSNTSWMLDKFRLRNKKIAISLVKTDFNYIGRKFGHKEPFRSLVFDK